MDGLKFQRGVNRTPFIQSGAKPKAKLEKNSESALSPEYLEFYVPAVWPRSVERRTQYVSAVCHFLYTRVGGRVPARLLCRMLTYRMLDALVDGGSAVHFCYGDDRSTGFYELRSEWRHRHSSYAEYLQCVTRGGNGWLLNRYPLIQDVPVEIGRWVIAR